MTRPFIIFALILTLASTGLAQETLVKRVRAKSAQVQQQIPVYIQSGGSAQEMKAMGERVKLLGQSGRLSEAEAVLDQMLTRMKARPDSAKSQWKELRVEGDKPENGIYDLSLEYDNKGTGWMAYSTVSNVRQTQSTVETHLARSDDGGKTWQYVADLNKAKPDTLNGERGVWWNEVPTLLHDPGDPGKEWKLFYHKYFAKMPYKGAEDRRLQYSWIATKSAPSPEGPWSEEEALFGAGQFPIKPYATRVNVSELHPDLASYFVLTELGSITHQGDIYLSLQAIRVDQGKPRFDLILLTSKDHGKSWQYVATPLRAEQAKAYGGDGWTGSSLVEEKGRVYLMVCPERNNRPVDGHLGTVVFEFSDLSRGQLKPSTVLRLKPDLSKGGQSDYDEQNIHGGIIFPQVDPTNFPRIFRLYRTEKKIAL